MNLLYCGDEKMQDGILLSLMSILKEVNEPLHVYILTMAFRNETKVFHPIQPEAVQHFNQLVKAHHTKSSVQLIRVDAMPTDSEYAQLLHSFCDTAPICGFGS